MWETRDSYQHIHLFISYYAQEAVLEEMRQASHQLNTFSDEKR